MPPESIYPTAGLEMTSWKNLPQTAWQVDLLKRHLPLEAGIVETGCNDGHFLTALRDGGFSRLLGVEPSRVSGPIARGKGFEVREGFATPPVAAELVASHGKFDLAVAKHMFGHIPDLNGYFSCLDTLLKPDGLLFLEIPDFGAALAAADCSLVYEELIGYFTSDTLRFALERFGYRVIVEHKFTYNGGLIEVLARRFPAPVSPRHPAIPGELADFARRAGDYAARLGARLALLRDQGWVIYVFGGGLRSAALLNGFGLAEHVAALLDDNPAKQGRYYPGCGLPLVAPETLADNPGRKAFLLAVGNENEAKVKRRIDDLFGGGALCASILSPNDRFAELRKLEAGLG
jgi:hypothetical protein